MAPGLDNLPDEIILSIFQSLPQLQDILRLRQVSCHLSDVGKSVIRQYCTKAYVYATPESLAGFEALCKHPLYSQCITEVVYVGAQYDPRLCSIDEYAADRAIRHVRAEFRLPNAVLRQQHEKYVETCRKQQQILESDEDIATLARNLPSLPRLTSLAYCARPRGKGLNMPRFWSLAMSESTTQCAESESKWELTKDLPRKALMEMELMRASLFRSFVSEHPSEYRPLWALSNLPEVQKKITFSYRRTSVEITDDYNIDELQSSPAFASSLNWLSGIDLELTCERGSELGLAETQIQGWMAMLKNATNLKRFRLSWHQRPLCALADAIMTGCNWSQLESATFSSVYLLQEEAKDCRYIEETPLIPKDSLMTFVRRHPGIQELKLWSRYTSFMTPIDGNDFQGLLLNLRQSLTHLKQATVVWEIPRLDRDAKMRDLADRLNVRSFTEQEYAHEVRKINAEMAEYTLNRTSHHHLELVSLCTRMRVQPYDLPAMAGGCYAPRIYDFGPMLTGRPSTAHKSPEVLFELF